MSKQKKHGKSSEKDSAINNDEQNIDEKLGAKIVSPETSGPVENNRKGKTSLEVDSENMQQEAKENILEKEGDSEVGAVNGAGIEAELLEQIKELEKENSELKEQYLRKQADFENFRKRMIREKEEAVRYANSALLLDLIAVLDDFERAIESANESKDFDSFHSGIELIEKQLVSMLDRKWGLKRLDSQGEEFDPDVHEAIGMEEDPNIETQTVAEDYQKGYLLHDRVLRHAKVRVAIPGNNEKTEENS